jgi:hypothetical protein
MLLTRSEEMAVTDFQNLLHFVTKLERSEECLLKLMAMKYQKTDI